jgi:hypothetical protein
MKLNRSARLALLLCLFVLALACRTADLIAQARPTAVNTRPRVANTTPRATRTEIVVEAQVIPSTPTDEPPPVQQPQQPAPTNAPRATTRPTNPPAPRATVRPPDTVPAPTATSQFLYQVQESRCGPNVRTYIEGYVYDNSVPKNDVLVRISQGPDGQPDPNDDFRTGSDPRKGYYFHNSAVNAPHQGTWYIWVLDPTTQQRISAIAIVKTDAERVEDTENSAGSCQSATVTFSNTGPRPIQRTPTPSRTRDPNAGPTPTPTQDVGDDS